MTARVYVAFSGNNSGTYALLGTLERAKADALCDELRAVFEAHDAWVKRDDDETPSPLYEYATKQGLTVSREVGTWDDWPHYGTPPEVVQSGDDVLVFVPYTADFPAMVGELIYRRGGRVEAELGHAHNPVVLTHTLWMHEGWRSELREAAQTAVRAFESDVRAGALAALYTARNERRGARPGPALRPGFWPGQCELVHVPQDAAEAMRAVDALATRHGLRVRTGLFEAPLSLDELARVFAATTRTAGQHQVILWRAGSDTTATVRALRTALGCTLAEAAERVAQAPIEAVREVSETEARRVFEALQGAGAEAELLGPEHVTR